MTNLLAIFTKIGQFQKVLARRLSLWPGTFFGQFVADLKKMILTKFPSGYLANLWLILGQISYFVMSLKNAKN
jgi:hypothetical protein